MISGVKNNFKNNKLATLIIILIAIVGAFLIRTFPPDWKGDGVEYILQMTAFQRHFSFGVKEEDVEQAASDFYLSSDAIRREYNNRTHMHISGDSRYSNHYGTYSALVALVNYPASALGLYPVWSFILTNYFLWIGSALGILLFLKAEKKKKTWCVLLSLVNPVMFYLSWTHPETFIYAFTVSGLVAYYNKHYARSILCLSIAAMQNLAVLPFSMMIGLNYIIDCIQQYRKKNNRFLLSGFIKQYGPRILPHGLCYFPGLLPIFSTFIRFGTVSLVADVARENKYLLHKAVDYLFDLNLGILPFEPVVLFLFLIMIVVGLVKCQRPAWINILGIVGMLYIIANQKQINSASQHIMRYNVWIIPILVFYVVMNWDGFIHANHGKMLFRVLMGTEVLITAVMFIYTELGDGGYVSYNFAPWTKVLMDWHPELYNPTHGIFYTRATGNETYNASFPVAYCDEDGHAKKILLSKQAEQGFEMDTYHLVNEKGEEQNKTELSRKKVDEGDYTYINLSENLYMLKKYKFGDVICFTRKDNNLHQFAQSGFSQTEEWGSWTDGDSAVVCLWIDEDAPRVRAHINIVNTFHPPQLVTFLVNDEVVLTQDIHGRQDISFVFSNDTHIVRLKMLIPGSLRPNSIMKSKDKRDLGIGIKSILFEEMAD